MSTSSHAVLAVVSGIVYSDFINFNIHGGKMHFFAYSQTFLCKKSLFGHFDVMFPNLYIFSRAGLFFSCDENQKGVL